MSEINFLPLLQKIGSDSNSLESIKNEPMEVTEYFNEGIIDIDSNISVEETVGQVIKNENIEYFNEGTIDELPVKESRLSFQTRNNNRSAAAEEITEAAVKNKIDVSSRELVREVIDECQVKNEEGCQVLRTEFHRTDSELYFLKEEINGGSIPDDDDFNKNIVFECRKCPFTTPHESKINNHKLLHSEPRVTHEEKPFKCDFPGCEQRLKTKRNLIRHSYVHSNAVYKCDKCPFVTNQENYLHTHTARIHDEIFELIHCDKCSFKTTLKQYLVCHQKVHKDPGERKLLKCKAANCSFETTSGSRLRRHSSDHIDPSRVLKCEKCHYYTKCKMNMAKHKRRNHPNTSNMTVFKCYTCPFQTHMKKSLKNHLIVHKQPFQLVMLKCPHCPFEAKRKCNLSQHLVKHMDASNMTLFKCALCSFETKRKNSLRNHIMTHRKKEK